MYRYILLIIFAFLASQARSQSSRLLLDSIANEFHSKSLQKNQASIYINTSKGIYETNEDLWFKATLLNEHTLQPYVNDQTLYVQLRNLKNDSIAYQGKFKIDQGFTDGKIFLTGDIMPGEYFLEAFSRSSFDSREREHSGTRKIIIVESILSFKGIPASKKEKPVLADFQLLPEGGHLIDGLPGKVAFKAVDSTGSPVYISGVVYENNTAITTFQTKHAGMGSFSLTPKQENKYRVEITTDSIELQTNIVFPEIKRRGISLELMDQNQEQLNIKVRNTSTPQDIFVRIQSRGIIQALAAASVEDSLTVQIPTKEFPQGIHEVSLLDAKYRPVAERLVYINWDKKLYIKTELSEETYGKKDKVSLKIKVTDKEGKPVQAHLSISVFDHQFENNHDTKNILTHYHLSEALKGKIYDPAFYFDGNNRAQELDLLLLTQGWRKYKWHEDNIKNHEPVLKDGISGQVIFGNPGNNPGAQNAVMVFDPIDNQNYFEALDSIGRFYIKPFYLELGKQLYIKHFDEEQKQKAFTRVENEFEEIDKINFNDTYPIANPIYVSETIPLTAENPYGNRLEEVELSGKGSSQYRNKFLGELNDVANFDFQNSDYIGIPCGTFNCPIHDMDQSKKPILGETYEKMIGFEWIEGQNQTNYRYKVQGYHRFVYQKTDYSEEELMSKFNLSKLEGYEPVIEFYTPNYENEELSFEDYRNTLLWQPTITTNGQGEYKTEFYTSNLVSKFLIKIEGFSNNGILGVGNNEFLVF